jgi:hypothetical protein
MNPKKCTFGVPRGELLGYIITECGIKVNPNKILAITKIGQVRNIKDKLLKKSDSFHWTDET